MQENIKKNKFLFTAATILLIGFITLSLFVITGFKLGETNNHSIFFKNISINKSTEKDVVSSLGEPENKNTSKNKTTLTYGSKYEVPKNTVVLKDDRVKYFIESVFSSDEGGMQKYINRYGQADIKLSDISSQDLEWSIFLKDGVGVAATAYGQIGKILRFSPMSKEDFMMLIAPDIHSDTLNEEPIPVP
jgi:hypothetical protein